MLVLGLACTAGSMAQGAGGRTTLDEGPCTGLAVSSAQASAYEDTLGLLAKANEGGLYVLGSDQWAVLAVPGDYAPLGQAEWVLASGSDAAQGLGADYSESYLPFATAGSATLYKHTSKASYITQG